MESDVDSDLEAYIDEDDAFKPIIIPPPSPIPPPRSSRLLQLRVNPTVRTWAACQIKTNLTSVFLVRSQCSSMRWRKLNTWTVWTCHSYVPRKSTSWSILLFSDLIFSTKNCMSTGRYLTISLTKFVNMKSLTHVGNPGILIQILLSWYQVLESFSHDLLLCYSYYEGPDPYLWRCYDIMGLDSYLLSMAQYLHHMIPLLRYALSANGLYPSYQLSGLCIRIYLTALHVQTSTEQYIQLALQPVSIMNYLVLIPPSSELWAHSHYAQVTPLL